MAADQQQGMTEFSTENPFLDEVPVVDQTQFSLHLSSRMTIPSWQGDNYIPTPPHNYVPPPQKYAPPPPPPPPQNYMHMQPALGNWPPPPPEFQGSQMQQCFRNTSNIPTHNVLESSSRMRIMNACYDPDYEVRGLHLDPHLRIFLATSNDVTQDNGGN